MKIGAQQMPMVLQHLPALLASVSELQAQRRAAEGGAPYGDTSIYSAEGSVSGIVADVWRYLCNNSLREVSQKLLRARWT